MEMSKKKKAMELNHQQQEYLKNQMKEKRVREHRDKEYVKVINVSMLATLTKN